MIDASLQQRSLFVIGLASRWFALDTGLVDVVVANDLPRTRIPTAPLHIEGVVNHRGRALAIFDLAGYLGIGAVSATPRLVVVTAGVMSAALPVESIRGVVTVQVADLRPGEESMAHTLGLIDLDVGPTQVIDLPGLLQVAAAQ